MNVKDESRLKPLYKFLRQLNKKPPRGLQVIAEKANVNVWKGIDCMSCANCCKTMSPIYSGSDIKRIAVYLKITVDEFKWKWLKKEKGTGDWINKTTPCQFLDLETNMCNIYDVRPANCAGFPHLTKKRFIDYLYVHKQNLNECPATFKMVERMKELVRMRSNV